MSNSSGGSYPTEGFTEPEVIDECDDCKAYVGEWITHKIRYTTAGEPNPDLNPSAASDAAVKWKRHVAAVHPTHARPGWSE